MAGPWDPLLNSLVGSLIFPPVQKPRAASQKAQVTHCARPVSCQLQPCKTSGRIALPFSGFITLQCFSHQEPLNLLSLKVVAHRILLLPVHFVNKVSNSIDHWLSFCPVAHLTWLALWVSAAPEINWRGVPSKRIGVALCCLLLHLRRLVTEHGGLQPVIACVRIRSILQHVLDLWQRVHPSLPSIAATLPCSTASRETSCVDSTKIRRQRFPAAALESGQSCGLEPDSWFWLVGFSGWFFVLVLVFWLGAACLDVRLISCTPLLNSTR